MKGNGEQADASDFLLAFLDTLQWEERGMQGYDQDSSRSVVTELFGMLVREREHCPRVDCLYTRDRVNESLMVDLVVNGREDVVVSLRDLWDAKFAKLRAAFTTCCDTSRPGTSNGEDAVLHESKQVQYFLDTEPPCLIIHLRRGAGRVKSNRPVSFPQRLDWLRTGEYVFCGVIFHHGLSAAAGHYTAGCAVDQRGSLCVEFDDEKVGKVKPFHVRVRHPIVG